MAKSWSVRTCDRAAKWLAPILMPDSTFDARAGLEERDVQIAQLRSAWRKARRLPPLLPVQDPYAAVPPAAPDLIEPLLDSVARGDEGARTAVLRLGLSALPAVRARRDALVEQSTEHARFDTLATELAQVIRSVTVEPAAPDTAALSTAAAEFVGRVLDGDRLVALVRAVNAARNNPHREAVIRIDRRARCDGFLLRVRLSPSNAESDDTALTIRRRVGGDEQVTATAAIGAKDTDELVEKTLREAWTEFAAEPGDRTLRFTATLR
jgi:hypothetical protein